MARTMTITVVLYAGLARYRPAGVRDRTATLDMAEGATVRDVMRRLGMPDDLSCIPVVSGARAAAERVLRDGETLSLFPPLAGGSEPQRAAARRRSECHALGRHRG
jgi:molybdopterin converting factor small subunit